MSVLEYARAHGLAFDHLSNDPTATFGHLQSILLEDLGLCETLPKDLRSFDESFLSERLLTTKESAIFLATSISEVFPPEGPDPYQTYRRMKAVRLETPHLPKDLAHGHTVHASDVEDEIPKILAQHDISRFGRDDDSEWSQEELNLSPEWTAAIESEKIDSTREVLLSIQSFLKDEYSSQIEADIIKTEEAELNYNKVRSKSRQ